MEYKNRIKQIENHFQNISTEEFEKNLEKAGMKTWEEINKPFRDHGLDPEKCTCLSCEDNCRCPFRFDLYNYDGDCIMEK